MREFVFDKNLINEQPIADFICPGHPLLEATIQIVIEQNFHMLEQGAIMVDENSLENEISSIFLIEHSIFDGKINKNGQNRIISKKLKFVKLFKSGEIVSCGEAPHLDLRPINEEEEKEA